MSYKDRQPPLLYNLTTYVNMMHLILPPDSCQRRPTLTSKEEDGIHDTPADTSTSLESPPPTQASTPSSM